MCALHLLWRDYAISYFGHAKNITHTYTTWSMRERERERSERKCS